MARPAATDSATTRRKLIEAASDAFARQGLDATSLRDVARAAGLTIASVHYHFGNKEGLHEACLDSARKDLRSEFAPFRDLLETIHRNARGAAKSRVTLPDLVDAAVRSAMRAVRQQREALRLLMRGLVEDGELDQRWLHGALAPFLTETAALLAKPLGIPQAELRLRIQSLVALVVRLALSSERELKALAGTNGKNGSKVLDLYEDHVVWLARRILLENKD